MKSDRWTRLKELLADALELPADQRIEFARTQCSDDPELLKELEDLIAIEEDLDGFLQPPDGHVIQLDRLHEEAKSMTEMESIGPFKLLRELGRGGRGVVYLARHKDSDKLVAVKVLSMSVLPSAVAVERFRREARAADKLEHPAIIKISQIDQDLGRPYLVMDHVDGRNLGEELELVRDLLEQTGPNASASTESSCLLPEGPESLPTAVATLVKKLAEALHHAHEHGIVHRDVKPQNILLDGAGEPYLVDFGLARDEAEVTLTQVGEVEGTPNYMSPEQVRAERDQIDRRTDIYSLGVVLYEMLTLRRPFDAPTARQVMHNITRRLPERVCRLNAVIPTSLETICQKAMSKRRRDRYETAEEFAQDLGRFLNRQAILAQAPGPVQRAVRAVQRNPLPWMASAASLVLVVATAAIVKSQAPDLDALAASLQPRVELELFPEAIAAGSEIYLRQLDAETLELGEAELIGTYPLDGPIRLSQGQQYLLIARAPGGQVGESDLLARNGAHVLQRLMRLVDPKDRPNMIRIPASEFEGNLLPALVKRDQTMKLPAFYMDEFLVTVGQYKEYLDATGQTYPLGFTQEFLADPKALKIPVTEISPFEAAEYCAWRGMRLGTIFESQIALRGEEFLFFPPGVDPEHPEQGFNFVIPTISEINGYAKFNPWRLEKFTAIDQLNPLDRAVSGIRMVMGHANELTSSPEGAHASITTGLSLAMDIEAVKVLGFSRTGAAINSIGGYEHGFRCAVSTDPLR
jgi:serine/threonine protein kinase/formylglycine-generating enzyme required for sulfatase activity